MSDSQKAKTYAIIGTAGITILVLLLLFYTHLHLSPSEPKENDRAPITLEEEEFVEVIPAPISPAQAHDTPAKAKADEQQPSQPTPASGTDIEDNGQPADAPEMVTKTEESPVKVKKKEPKKTGPSAEEIKKKKEEEEIKRKANNEVTDAFSRSKGKHNNASSSTKDKGNDGVPSGTAPSGTHTGHGGGTAGGGWAIPAYAAVPSTVTGSVKMTVSIDRNGNVTKLTFTGGDAPAATNPAVRNACAAEVKSRRFTRSNPDNAPEISTAYITYTFR